MDGRFGLDPFFAPLLPVRHFVNLLTSVKGYHSRSEGQVIIFDAEVTISLQSEYFKFKGVSHLKNK